MPLCHLAPHAQSVSDREPPPVDGSPAAQGGLLQEMSKLHLDMEALKQQLLTQEIAYNIQQTEALTRCAWGVVRGRGRL